MKHWDLSPGETLQIHRCLTDGTEILGSRHIRARYRYRDTVRACFELPDGTRMYFSLRADGLLADSNDRLWTVAGADRHTRHVIREPLGEKRGFTGRMYQEEIPARTARSKANAHSA